MTSSSTAARASIRSTLFAIALVFGFSLLSSASAYNGRPKLVVIITIDQFRKWAGEVDRERQNVEGVLDRLRRIFR